MTRNPRTNVYDLEHFLSTLFYAQQSGRTREEAIAFARAACRWYPWRVTEHMRSRPLTEAQVRQQRRSAFQRRRYFERAGAENTPAGRRS